MDELRFGTDGWRDRIGERFTVDNVRRAAQATADEVRARGGSAVVVAHDTRFGGAMFAQAAAETLAANGLTVHLAEGSLPTPVLSFAVKHLGADAGVMLTASHNPPEWNGFKLKGSYGGTATQDVYRAVAARVASVGQAQVRTSSGPDDRAGTIVPLDVRDAYYDALAAFLDMDTLRQVDGRLVHDAMGGAAAGWMTGFARHAGLPIEVEEVRSVPDPMFYGAHPEPIPVHMGPLIRALETVDANAREVVVGVATDGDGDRLGAVLPGGRPVNSHEILTLLLDRRDRDGARGRVVKTFTVARLVERLATLRGHEVVETPVGFKWLVDEMLKGDVLIAGEESGGIGVPDHLPERDGIANGFLLLQAAASALREDGPTTTEGGPLALRLEALQREADWRHAYDRVDLRLSGEAAQRRVSDALRVDPDRFAGRTVTTVERLDGVKMNLEGHAWVLVRPSGTEPLLRLYCEASSPTEVAEILAAAETFVDDAARPPTPD